MRVNVCTTLDFDGEVEIDFDQILDSLAAECRSEEQTRDGQPRRAISALDYLTRILAGVPDETIERIKPLIRDQIRERLATQLARYAP